MASAVAQRYRDADTIQAQRIPAKPQDFATVLSSEPSVVASIGHRTLNPPPPSRPVAEAAVPTRAVARTVLPSPALARRGTSAYEAAASIGRPFGADAEVSTPAASGLSIEC